MIKYTLQPDCSKLLKSYNIVNTHVLIKVIQISNNKKSNQTVQKGCTQ